jgi:hypothetical protein
VWAVHGWRMGRPARHPRHHSESFNTLPRTFRRSREPLGEPAQTAPHQALGRATGGRDSRSDCMSMSLQEHITGLLWPGWRERGHSERRAVAARVCAPALHGAWRMPMRPSQKGACCSPGATHQSHVMYETCWEGVHAGRGPWATGCVLCWGDRRRQIDALARPTRVYRSAISNSTHMAALQPRRRSRVALSRRRVLR